MAVSMQQAVLFVHKQHLKRSKTIIIASTFISLLSISACQTVPTAAVTTVQQTAVVDDKAYTGDRYSGYDNYNSYDESLYADDYVDDYIVEPYIVPEQAATPDSSTAPTSIIITPSADLYNPDEADSSNDRIIIPQQSKPTAPVELPSHAALLESARQNSKQQSRQPTSNQSDLPAFRNLMQTAIKQLKSGNLSAAESSFTRAQRLAPQSSAIYFYLSQVALKKNQPRKAEAMARRGLNVSQDDSRRRALWQLILRSGQLQNNQRVIREAQQALR
jgi:ribosomal protein S20